MASGDFQRWQLSVESALDKLFGENSTHVRALRDVWFTPAVMYSDTEESEWQRAFLDGLFQAKGILDAAIDATRTYAASPNTAESTTKSAEVIKADKVDPSALTVGALLKALTPGQAWGLVASLILLIGGSFTLGVKLSDYRLDRAKARIEELEEAMKSAPNGPRNLAASSSQRALSPPRKLSPIDLTTIPGIAQKNYSQVLERIRADLKVRPLTALEDGNLVSSASPATFGLVSAVYLTVDENGKSHLSWARLRRNAFRSSNFELARPAQGDMVLVAFVSATDGVRLQHLDGTTTHKVTLFPMPWSEASTLVLLPIDRLQFSADREIDTEAEGGLMVLDASLR